MELISPLIPVNVIRNTDGRAYVSTEDLSNYFLAMEVDIRRMAISQEKKDIVELVLDCARKDLKRFEAAVK